MSGESIGQAVSKTAFKEAIWWVGFWILFVPRVGYIILYAAYSAPDAPIERFDDDTKGGTGR